MNFVRGDFAPEGVDTQCMRDDSRVNCGCAGSEREMSGGSCWKGLGYGGSK